MIGSALIFDTFHRTGGILPNPCRNRNLITGPPAILPFE